MARSKTSTAGKDFLNRFAQSVENYSAGLGDVGLKFYQGVPNFFASIGSKVTGTPNVQLDLSGAKVRPVTGNEPISRGVGNFVGDIAMSQVAAQGIAPEIGPLTKPVGSKASKLLSQGGRFRTLAGKSLANVGEGLKYTTGSALLAPFENRSTLGSIGLDLAIDTGVGLVLSPVGRNARRTVSAVSNSPTYRQIASETGSANLWEILGTQTAKISPKDTKNIERQKQYIIDAVVGGNFDGARKLAKALPDKQAKAMIDTLNSIDPNYKKSAVKYIQGADGKFRGSKPK